MVKMMKFGNVSKNNCTPKFLFEPKLTSVYSTPSGSIPITVCASADRSQHSSESTKMKPSP